MIDRARRSGRELLMPEVDLDVRGALPAGERYPDIAAQWENPDALAVARDFIAQLSPELARVHHARYVEGRSQRDAAEQLGITRQTLRTLESKLREGLRMMLRRSQVPEPLSDENLVRTGSSSGLR
jgi:DNA-directed RNA polymerase specialized sigma24 family protein